MDEPSKPNQLNFDKKEMLRNGYMEVIVEEPVEGLNKGDVVLIKQKKHKNKFA